MVEKVAIISVYEFKIVEPNVWRAAVEKTYSSRPRRSQIVTNTGDT